MGITVDADSCPVGASAKTFSVLVGDGIFVNDENLAGQFIPKVPTLALFRYVEEQLQLSGLLPATKAIWQTIYKSIRLAAHLATADLLKNNDVRGDGWAGNPFEKWHALVEILFRQLRGLEGPTLASSRAARGQSWYSFYGGSQPAAAAAQLLVPAPESMRLLTTTCNSSEQFIEQFSNPALELSCYLNEQSYNLINSLRAGSAVVWIGGNNPGFDHLACDKTDSGQLVATLLQTRYSSPGVATTLDAVTIAKDLENMRCALVPFVSHPDRLFLIDSASPLWVAVKARRKAAVAAAQAAYAKAPDSQSKKDTLTEAQRRAELNDSGLPVREYSHSPRGSLGLCTENVHAVFVTTRKTSPVGLASGLTGPVLVLTTEGTKRFYGEWLWSIFGHVS